MQFTLSQVETFYWVARLGSFHAAARHLHVTQPAISVRIRGLEAELGAPLFQRSHSKARLTPEGAAILPQAERMLSLATEMKKEAVAGRGLRGLIRLGVVETVARLALPNLLAHLARKHPGIQVQVAVDIGTALSHQLYERELDVVINTDPRPREQVRTEVLGKIEMAWIAAPDHPLRNKRVRPSDLRQDRIFTNSRGSTAHDLTETWFRTGRIEPENMNLCNSVTTMAALVAVGQGVAVVSPAMFRDEIASGRLTRLRTVPAVPPRPLLLSCLPEVWSEEIADLVERTRGLFETAGAFVP
jgi:DNA-binding transcriptional LysR family regulator